MQMASGQNNQRIRDLERVYLQKYPGHTEQPVVPMIPQTSHSLQSRGGVASQIQFTQYINNPASNNIYQIGTQGARRKGASAMRGNFIGI